MPKSTWLSEIRRNVAKGLKPYGFVREKSDFVRRQGDVTVLIEVYSYPSRDGRRAGPEEMFLDVKCYIHSESFLQRSRCLSGPIKVWAPLTFSVFPETDSGNNFWQVRSDDQIGELSSQIVSAILHNGLPLIETIKTADDIALVYEKKLGKVRMPIGVFKHPVLIEWELRAFRGEIDPCTEPLPKPPEVKINLTPEQNAKLLELLKASQQSK